MPALTWGYQHRFWALGIGFAMLIAIIAAGVWFFVLRNPGTPVDVRQALRLYRQGQRAGDAGSIRLPPPGVYRYRTSGAEHLDFAGISRAFPADSDMIVTESRCATMRWEPLEQHIEGLVECPQNNGVLSIRSALSFEQIAGIETTSIIQCPVGAYFVPPDPSIGRRWRTTCHSTGQNVVFSGQVLGASKVNVGGRNVPALHTRLDLSFSGSESGTNPNDYWVSLKNGLILRQNETVDVSQRAGPLGSVRYTERMAITLTSTAPIR